MYLEKYFAASGKNVTLAITQQMAMIQNQNKDSLNSSQNVDDIFAEGFSSPDCVTILVNCIKNVEKQAVEIFSKTEETKNSQIKGEQHLIELNKTATLISKKFDADEKEKLEREKAIKEMFMNIRLLRQEQYSRRNCLPIHGLL